MSSQDPRSLCQMTPNMLIQMSGVPGSGKSTTAKLLAPLIDGVIIDHDIIRSSLLDDDLPWHQAARAAYRLNWALAESIIQQGRTVIIDSTSNYQEIVDKGTALARKYGYDYWYIECSNENLDVLDDRLRSRTPLRSQRTGVARPPADAAVDMSEEDALLRFQRWMGNPCRPTENVIVVEPDGDLSTRGKDLLERMYPGRLSSHVTVD